MFLTWRLFKPDQLQFHSSSNPDILADIQEVFTNPEQSPGWTQVITPIQEMSKYQARHKYLHESSTHQGQNLSTETKRYMPRFMKRQIDSMQKYFKGRCPADQENPGIISKNEENQRSESDPVSYVSVRGGRALVEPRLFREIRSSGSCSGPIWKDHAPILTLFIGFRNISLTGWTDFQDYQVLRLLRYP